MLWSIRILRFSFLVKFPTEKMQIEIRMYSGRIRTARFGPLGGGGVGRLSGVGAVGERGRR